MGENVHIISSAYLEFVMMPLMPVLGEVKENHAMTTLSVIEGWRVDQVSYGLMRLNAFLWVTLTLDVKPIMTVNLAISAGKNTSAKRTETQKKGKKSSLPKYV